MMTISKSFHFNIYFVLVSLVYVLDGQTKTISKRSKYMYIM